jgi:hypothetical protein
MYIKHVNSVCYVCMSRYLSTGLVGKDSLEQAQVDELTQSCYDFTDEQYKVFFASDDVKV